MALDVFQLWPVDGGTLVWQVGFVSAPFRSYLGGVDRYIAGKQMTQETLDTIKAFRAEFGKRSLTRRPPSGRLPLRGARMVTQEIEPPPRFAERASAAIPGCV